MTDAFRSNAGGAVRLVVAVAITCLLVVPATAQNKVLDCTMATATDDWCFGNIARGAEDTSAALSCLIGNPPFQVAVEEIVWYDAPGDGTVNDLATFAIAPDADGLYLFAELWVDPDPTALPHGQVAIDVQPGGSNAWFDPGGNLTTPGRCVNLPDVACTTDADCSYCDEHPQRKICGQACDPTSDGVCTNLTDTCDFSGSSLVSGDGTNASPPIGADFLIIFDFARWLAGRDFVLVTWDDGGSWSAIPNPGDQSIVFGTNPGYDGCVDPGQSGGSSGPPGKVEIFIPWYAFTCERRCNDDTSIACSSDADCGAGDTCPVRCGPGANPLPIGQSSDFNTQLLIARDDLNEDYNPFGAMEDVFSEPNPGSETRTTDACPTPTAPVYQPCPGCTDPREAKAESTRCELADASADAWIMPVVLPPGGRIDGLLVDRTGTQLDLSWSPSCSNGDTDYELYTGTIGSWYSHDQALCTTGGSTAASITAGADSEYYLIVPSGGGTEGSYGERSDTATERPQGTTTCAAQSLGTCP